ncbi:MAG: hypothetical protein WA947_01930 [Phormidesmis sp.]
MKSLLISATLLGFSATGAIAADTLRYDETPTTCEFYTEDSYADDCGEFSMTASDTSVNFNYVFDDAAVKFMGPAEPVDTTEIEGETFYIYEVFAKLVNGDQYEIDGICVANEAAALSICQDGELRYVYSQESQ